MMAFLILSLLILFLLFRMLFWHTNRHFKNKLKMMLVEYENYLQEIMKFSRDDKELNTHKRNIIKLLKQSPDWVYKSGFKPIMQQGHRHFLVMTERAAHILLQLHALTFHLKKIELDAVYADILSFNANQIAEMLKIIVKRLDEKNETIDFEQKELTISSDLLEISEQYQIMVMFYYALADLFKTVRALFEAL